MVSVAIDDSLEAIQPWIEAADPRPTYPIVLDRDHATAEGFGIVNIPATVWIDEQGTIVRPADIAPADDQFRSFTHIDSSVHHDELRRWVHKGTLPLATDVVRARQHLPSPEVQLARAERRLGAHLRRTGNGEAGARHLARAVELAPLDWTIRRGSMPLTGQDPFGTEFFEFWQEWEAAGRPDAGVTGLEDPA